MEDEKDAKIFLDLMKEIERLKSQQDANLADYSMKVAGLDAQIKGLASKKEGLVAEILALENDLGSAQVSVSKARNEADGIIKAAVAEAKEIIEKATVSAEVTIKNSSIMEENAKAIKREADALESEANQKVKYANEAFGKAESVKKQSINLLADAENKVNKAYIFWEKAEAMIEQADAKQKAVEASEQSIIEAQAKIDEQKSALLTAELLLKDKYTAFDTEKAGILADLEEKRKALELKESEVATLRDHLIKQKEINAFKNAELDAGFSKLKREQDELKKSKIIVDNMKKELSKEGA